MTVVPQLGVIGSAVSTASLGIQVQKGTPRTVVTMDLNGAEQIYWQRPGGKENYTGSFDMSFVHRLTPRATLSVDVNAVYQQTPNFALINAPTNNGNNGGGSYLNGNAIVNLTYQWGSRISSVTTYNMAMNLLESNSSGNLYSNTFGQQFRYTVSARNTATVEVRESTTQYPSEPSANSSGTFLLLGLDSILSARLTNHLNFGLESDSYTSGNSGQTIPYMESATTLALPRGSALQWTNRYGSENTGSPFITESSYRTTLSYSQPLSTKLLATVSLAYNYLQATDTQTAAGSYKQNQLQTSLNLGYTITPRFSLNLSYTYNDLISTQVNSSYQRDQTFLGGTYLFQ